MYIHILWPASFVLSCFTTVAPTTRYSLSKRLGVVFTIFEALPVLGAMLFRTGYTGLQSRWPLIISFSPGGKVCLKSWA